MPLVSVPGYAMGTTRAVTFLLDSDTCVFWLRGQSAVQAWLNEVSREEIGLSVIIYTCGSNPPVGTEFAAKHEQDLRNRSGPGVLGGFSCLRPIADPFWAAFRPQEGTGSRLGFWNRAAGREPDRGGEPVRGRRPSAHAAALEGLIESGSHSCHPSVSDG
jgi:hypothetical protein